MRLPVAANGIPYILLSLAISVSLWLLSFRVAAAILLAMSMFITWFFRDPKREINGDSNALLSPADGRIIGVNRLDAEDGQKQGHSLVSIFMSLFDCHIHSSVCRYFIHCDDHVILIGSGPI